MAVLIQTPDLICDNPVENCVPFTILPDEEYITDTGFRPLVLLYIDTNATSQPDGATITILGQEFTINNNGINNHEFIDWATPGLTTAQVADNIAQALNANFVIGGNASIVAFPSGLVYTIEVVWNEYVTLGNDIWQFDYSNLVNWSANANHQEINGVPPTITKGYEIVWQLYCLNSRGEGELVCGTHSAPPPILSPNIELPIELDFSGILSNLVSSPFYGKETINIFRPIPEAKKEFYLRYGTKRDKEPCGVEFGEFQQSDTFSVINASCQYLEDGFDDFCFSGSVFNAEKVRFLTDRPKGFYVCDDSLQWLRICLDAKSESPIWNYFVRVQTFDKNGASLAIENIAINANEEQIEIPTGTANINELTGSNFGDDVCSYSITIFVGLVAPIVAYSETFTYRIKRNCCCDAEVYFLNDRGGYDTLQLCKIVSRDLVTTQTEVCSKIPCKGEVVDSYNFGKRQVNTSSFERVTFETNQYQKNEDLICWFSQFKRSEKRFICVRNKQGQKQVVGLLIEGGTLRIFEDGQKLKVNLVGYYNYEYNNLSS